MTAYRPLPEVSTERRAATARVEAGPPGGECRVNIGGDWRLNEPVPSWTGLLGERTATRVRVAPENLGQWDSALVRFQLAERLSEAIARASQAVAADLPRETYRSALPRGKYHA